MTNVPGRAGRFAIFSRYERTQTAMLTQDSIRATQVAAQPAVGQLLRTFVNHRHDERAGWACIGMRDKARFCRERARPSGERPALRAKWLSCLRRMLMIAGYLFFPIQVEP